MNIFHVAYYIILRNFRDTKSLMMMLIFPVVLILILGTALSGSFATGNIEKAKVSILNEDEAKEPMSEEFMSFLSNDMKELLEVIELSSYDEGIKQVEEGKVQAFIHIEKNFTKNMMAADKTVIKVYNSPRGTFQTSMVKNIIDGFVDVSNSYMASAKLGSQTREYMNHVNIEEHSISVKGTKPRAIDYYAVTMLIMTMMYGTLYGGQAITSDKHKNTYIRLNTAPIRQSELVIGQVLGTIVTLFLQAVILIAFTKLAYKVDWGTSIPFILFVCISIIILSVSLGIMVFKLFGNPNAANALLSIMIQIFTFIAGGYVPIDILSSTLEKFSVLSPNYLAQQAIFNTIFSGPGAETQSFLIIIWVASAGMFIASALAGRRAPQW
ncbi:MAG: ABC transporter permease [Bacillota bacterium]